MRIGFCGLGLMGEGMARNFVEKGWKTTVWNRTRARAEAMGAPRGFAERGAERNGAPSNYAEVAPTPAALAAAVDVMITSLSDPAAVRAVALGPEGLLAGARAGARWIETSTIGRPAVLELAAAAAERGVGFLEAPVTGSKMGARSGKLLAMTGGDPALHEELAPVLGVFAARAIHVGPLGSAAVMKLVGNTIISFMLEGLAEGAVVAERAGIPLARLLEVVQASGFASPYWDFKGGQMVRRDFDTHFALELLHKDQALMLAEGAARRVSLPGLAAIHQVTQMALAMGLGQQDIAAQIVAIEKASGG